MFKSIAIAVLVSSCSAQAHYYEEIKQMMIEELKEKIGDGTKCINDLETVVDDARAALAYFEAGNETDAANELVNILTVVLNLKADCAQSKYLESKTAATFGDDPDPRREYFEKIGAQFANAFLFATHVGTFDEITLFQCLQREPDAVKYFYEADEKLKEALIKKQPEEATWALYMLINFVSIMAKENVPGRKEAICYEMDSKSAHWEDIDRINRELFNLDTNLAFADGHMFFNHHDITEQAKEMGDKYIKGDWHGLGYVLGKTLDEASKPSAEQDVVNEELFLF